MTSTDDLKAIVKQTYGASASRVAQGAGGCCGSAPDALANCSPITADLYDERDAGAVPREAMLASLGCGNPTALAELRPGETVLDLGSGGGIDVLLSARRVGPEGTAYGLDMTEPMLALALENKRRSGLRNVHFLRGEIEHVPLPANSVDVIISNCVINLAADKDRVLREAWRVLRPGGRLAVSDVVVLGELPPALRRRADLWAGCVAGALSDREYLDKLAAAGFEQAAVEVTRVYDAADVAGWLEGQDDDTRDAARQFDGRLAAGFVRAVKPLAAGAAVAAPVPATEAATAEAAAPASCCGPRNCCG